MANIIRSTGTDGLEVLTNILSKYTGAFLNYKEISFTPTFVDGFKYIYKYGKYFRIVDTVFDIREFGVKGNYNKTTGTGADDTLAIQKAFDSLSAGDVLNIPSGLKCKITDTITLNKYQIEIVGNRSEIHYVGTSKYAFNTGKVLSNIYPVGIIIRDISIFIDGAPIGTVAWGLGSSTSIFNNLQVAMNKADQVGFEIMGDENGTGSYYNIYTNLRAQGNSSTGQHWIKFTYNSAFPSRCPNANTFIGGRGGQCDIGVLVNGNGNYFYNPIIEGTKTTVFNFSNPDSSVGCTNNVVHGAYVEGASGANVFVFSTNSNSNKVTMPYITSVGAGVNFIDSGTNNRWEAASTIKVQSKGFNFDSLSALDFPTVLGPGAGIKLKDKNNNNELVIRNGSATSGGTDFLNITDIVNGRTLLKAGIASTQFYGNNILFRNDSTFGIFTPSQNPEAFLTAKRGSLALNINTGEIFSKTTDTGNTGWIKIGPAPIVDTTSTPYTKSIINAAYPTATIGTTVIQDNAGYTYIKKDNSPTGNWSVYTTTQLT